MPRQLIITGNDEKKSPETQLSQIALDLVTTSKFINGTQSNEIFSFPINLSGDLTTTSTNFTQINPLVIQFDNTSDYIDLRLNLCLSATNDGFIDIVIDNASILSIPFLFSGTNKQIININRIITTTAGSHIIKVFWKVSAGTITMYSTGNNFIQGFNFY